MVSMAPHAGFGIFDFGFWIADLAAGLARRVRHGSVPAMSEQPPTPVTRPSTAPVHTLRPAALRRRPWVQAGFLLVWLDPLMLRLHQWCGPVFHCYSCPLALFACPIGVLANFSAWHAMPFIAIGTLVLAGAAVGTLVCGWACPFGFLQDLANRLPIPKVTPPRWMMHGRYLVLAGLVVAIPFFFGEGHALFICRVCPAGGLEGAVPTMAQQAAGGGAVVWPSAVKLGVVAAFLVATLFVWRPWCTVLCPLGGILGLFNRVSAFFLRTRPGVCTQCRRCRSYCHYGVQPDRRLNDPRCVRCFACTRCSAIAPATIFDKEEAKRSTAEAAETAEKKN
jgi:ferredoxin-type protein NapH